MAYLTESKLSSVVDLPLALPSTLLKQGNFVVAASVKLVAGQRLTLRSLNLHLQEAPVDTTLIDLTNKVLTSLGLIYVVLRRDYSVGNPGSSGALDVLKADNLGLFTRTTTPLVLTAPGNYSLICVNNMQASTSSPVSSAIPLDFRVVVNGQLRHELGI